MTNGPVRPVFHGRVYRRHATSSFVKPRTCDARVRLRALACSSSFSFLFFFFLLLDEERLHTSLVFILYGIESVSRCEYEYSKGTNWSLMVMGQGPDRILGSNAIS